MAFREVSVVQVKEALRHWLRGEGERPIGRGVGVDRRTARRYIVAAAELAAERRGGEEQLTGELIGQVVERVREKSAAVACSSVVIAGAAAEVPASWWSRSGPEGLDHPRPFSARRRRGRARSNVVASEQILAHDTR